MVKIIEEMGESEINAINALKLAGNNVIEAVRILGMINHKDIGHYIEIATRKVK